MAIALFLIAGLIGMFAALLPITYTVGRRQGRREMTDQLRQDLLDRAERFSYGDKDRERELAKTLLTLLVRPENDRA